MKLYAAIHTSTDGYTYCSDTLIGIYSTTELADKAISKFCEVEGVKACECSIKPITVDHQPYEETCPVTT